MIKLRHNMVIFQQQIIWEDRGTFGYPQFYTTICDPVAKNKLYVHQGSKLFHSGN